MGTKVHHLTNILLLGLAPVAFLGHPSVSFPVDCILGTVIPIHAHIGLNSVISDYVPKALRSKYLFFYQQQSFIYLILT